MLRFLPLTALALAAPAHSALLFTGTAIADGSGLATLSGGGDGPGFTGDGSIWIRSRQGSFDGATWTVYIDYTKLWWDPYGDIDPDTGEFIPTLTGNNYFVSPQCTVSPGAPGCSELGLRFTLLRPDLLRMDFTGPVSFNNCTPVFTGDTSDCAFLYETPQTSYDLYIASDRDVPVDFFNANPVPEPASWAMLIAGFGLVGATLRRRRAGFS